MLGWENLLLWSFAVKQCHLAMSWQHGLLRNDKAC